MSVAIVTDSTSDLDPARAAELGVTVVPLFVLFGGKSYRDYLDVSRADFYQHLERDRVLPTTSQPSPEMFADAFAPHVAANREIVCLTISSELSGTINAARSAAEGFSNAKIHVIDSRSVAGGLLLQVLHARDLALAGASSAQILEGLAHDRQTQRLYAVLPDLTHVVRTGRIGRAAGAIGNLMKIVPVLRLQDGFVEAEARVRTFNRAVDTMIDATLRSVRDRSRARLMVMHTKAPELAERTAATLRERLGAAPQSLELLEAGPVIATHAGAGAVGIFSVE
ncbi:MAG: DegV family protein [Candidatus Eremiobacteraeota bacterium]|nr:DegV family protein [Candidatus Eremiobacteraeota bacterium]